MSQSNPPATAGQNVPIALLARLRERLGPAGYSDDPALLEASLRDARELYRGSAPALLRPDSTEAVSFVVRECVAHGVALVALGGNTGYMGGAVTGLDGAALPLSLARMNRIRALDAFDYSLVAEAGCVLADLQQAAADADRLLPLSLAAEGSCQIGGNLSTNAGGVQVLRYGNARDLVLGLEVVLADGRIWNGLRTLRKDNTGYDLKQLFLGAEGTLGIITAAALKLYPAPRESCTLLAALPDPRAATALLVRLRDASGDGVSSFEYFHRACLELVCEHIAGCQDPFDAVHEHYALIELTSGRRGAGLRELTEESLAEGFEAGELSDAVIAASADQAARLWRLREAIPEAQRHAGGCIKHDVSVPVARVPEFLERARPLAEALIVGVRVTPFGHMGDGNIHFNLSQPRDAARDAFLTHSDAVTRAVHDLVAEMGGSFSAEHGIGRLKREELRHYRPALDLELMTRIKQALDPQGLMNPGVIL